MFWRLARGLAALAATLFVVSVLIFAMTERAPGDAAEAQLGASATEENLTALREKMGLHRPPAERYAMWMGGVLRGDLGLSTSYRVPVSGLIAERLAVTLPLTLGAVLLAAIVALPLGAFAGARPGGFADVLATIYAQFGVAAPNFWIGLLLVSFVAANLGLPSGGFPGWEKGLWPGLRALFLPALALAIPVSAVLTRVTRAAVAETMTEDFIRTARAKGASRTRALWRHALPNALGPTVTMLGLQISALLAGAALVENVFTLPGLGRLIWQALAQRDDMVVRNAALLLAAAIVIVNMLSDALSARLDPRLRTPS